MTISTTTNKAQFSGSGTTGPFPFTYKVFDSGDLTVVRTSAGTDTTLTITTDYTVSLNADQNNDPGGEITLVSALAVGQTLTVLREVDASQETDITNGGGFYPEVIENALDKLTMLVQQTDEEVGRALTLPVSAIGTSAQLPVPSANQVIGWNGTGDALVNLDGATLATQIVGANTIIDTFSGDGSTTAFVLSHDPLTENNTNVYISGVYQQKSQYSITGTTLTFTAAPPTGANNIEVVQAQAQTYPVSSLADGVVSTTAIVDGAVTTAKILDGAVTDSKLSSTLLKGISAGTTALSFRNKIINGGFSIAQRSLGATADDNYCVDRWYVLTETGNVTVAVQSDQENGTPYNVRLTQPDAGAKQIGLAQIVESLNCKDLRGKNATLKFRVRNSTGAQINYAILEWSGTADVVTSDVVSAWAGSPTYVASITERVKGTVTPSANTWTDVTAITGAINAATNNLIVFIWSNADMAQNATLDIARVQLEEGSTATPFEVRPFSFELQLCERYYEAPYVFVPASPSAIPLYYEVRKRTAPSVSGGGSGFSSGGVITTAQTYISQTTSAFQTLCFDSEL